MGVRSESLQLEGRVIIREPVEGRGILEFGVIVKE